MQIIITKDTTGIGQKGDLLNVKRGYFYNFLEPRSLAIVATKALLAQAEQMRAKREVKQGKVIEQAAEVKEKLEKSSLSFEMKAKDGKVYGSVSEKEIIAAVKKELNIELAKGNFPEREHIKEVGIFKIPVSLAKNVTATLTIEVKEA